MFKLIIKFLCLSIILTLSGCAIHYHSAETGADHIWGFGHLAMKTVPDSVDKQILITQKTLTGIALGFDGVSPSFSIGWNQNERITILDKNTSLAIQRPSNDDYFQFQFAAFPEQFKNNNK